MICIIGNPITIPGSQEWYRPQKKFQNAGLVKLGMAVLSCAADCRRSIAWPWTDPFAMSLGAEPPWNKFCLLMPAQEIEDVTTFGHGSDTCLDMTMGYTELLKFVRRLFWLTRTGLEEPCASQGFTSIL